MTARCRTLPLGIDIGAARIRVALAEVAGGNVNLLAVATRERDGDDGAALAAAVSTLATRERRAVLALGPPDARLEPIALPPMPAAERHRTARFEAARFSDDPDLEIALAPLGEPRSWALGIARRAALAVRLAAAGSARLRVRAFDDAALAARRAHPGADAILDVGRNAARFITYLPGPLPATTLIAGGGDAFTAGIGRSLGIDPVAAEDRKRATGFAGAGLLERDALIAAVCERLSRARAVASVPFRRLVLTGNGSRIRDLAEPLAAAAAIDVAHAAFAPDLSTTLPADVLRAAAADWSIAVGCALWERDA